VRRLRRLLRCLRDGRLLRAVVARAGEVVPPTSRRSV
jgi:hypothetical protein